MGIMKKCISVLLAICLCFTCITGCSFWRDERMISDKEKEYRVLFVGNSFTEFNNLANDIFKPMCNQAGYNVIVDTVTRGSYILENFANSADPYGAKIDEFLNANKYDILILQEQSHRPISDFDSFLRGAKRLSEKAKENGGDVYLYETWGYKTGNGALVSFGGTTKVMAEQLSEAYEEVAEEIDATVIHAGLAMLDVYEKHEEVVELYYPDKHHPSLEGSILVGYTMLYTICDVDKNDVEFVTNSDRIDKILKNAAWEAACN